MIFECAYGNEELGEVWLNPRRLKIIAFGRRSNRKRAISSVRTWNSSVEDGTSSI